MGNSSQAQTVCATATENAVLTITAPSGNKFTAVNFASYGTPNGSCGSFTISSCHAANSANIVAAAVVGKTTASINASNGVFGDPCVGTVKRLYVEAAYSAILPLTLVNFRYEKIDNGHLRLVWRTEDESDTKEFVVEQSNDGVAFIAAGTVKAVGHGGKTYELTVKAGNEKLSFFRLRMVDIDGLFKYSHILRCAGDDEKMGVSYDVSGNVYVTSNELQTAALFNANGQLIKKVVIKPGRQILSTTGLHSGLYLLKTSSGVLKIVRP